MNENIIQFLQNEDDINRLLGIRLAVNEGWSVDDIFKYLKCIHRGHVKYYQLNHLIFVLSDHKVRLFKDINQLWKIITENTIDKLKEYQEKFIELLLN